MKQVLIIDDEYHNRLLLEEILEEYDEELNITSVKDGEQGLKKLQEEKFDVVFLDIMLPIIDGIQIIDTVKCKWKQEHVKIILLTAKADGFGENAKYLDYVDAYIKKPYKAQTILDTLKPLLESR